MIPSSLTECTRGTFCIALASSWHHELSNEGRVPCSFSRDHDLLYSHIRKVSCTCCWCCKVKLATVNTQGSPKHELSISIHMQHLYILEAMSLNSKWYVMSSLDMNFPFRLYLALNIFNSIASKFEMSFQPCVLYITKLKLESMQISFHHGSLLLGDLTTSPMIAIWSKLLEPCYNPPPADDVGHVVE